MKPPLFIQLVFTLGAAGILILFLAYAWQVFALVSIIGAIGFSMIFVALFLFFMYAIWHDNE